jgi:hypothetical protein
VAFEAGPILTHRKGFANAGRINQFQSRLGTPMIDSAKYGVNLRADWGVRLEVMRTT